ncbi:hypothetical protein M378DRAFT_917997 [Amanita muscaria Koide BX008]|uniref:Uncharacterized protein n=1 Tax=Amanita muscaria (strain Koide BX008) TaxID=946122 RepID=A0A0C2WVW9_AMAMK|nr:hypothetical protein M378DRAFT_917997 [Amanita muscaria Koide BX008]
MIPSHLCLCARCVDAPICPLLPRKRIARHKNRLRLSGDNPELRVSTLLGFAESRV